jgi:hypothetical protein
MEQVSAQSLKSLLSLSEHLPLTMAQAASSEDMSDCESRRKDWFFDLMSCPRQSALEIFFSAEALGRVPTSGAAHDWHSSPTGLPILRPARGDTFAWPEANRSR